MRSSSSPLLYATILTLESEFIQWSEPESFVSVLNKKLPAAHIDDVSVADLISHVSGRFLPLNPDVDRTEFPSVNIFTPPMATIVTSIPSLSRGMPLTLIPWVW